VLALLRNDLDEALYTELGTLFVFDQFPPPRTTIDNAAVVFYGSLSSLSPFLGMIEGTDLLNIE